MAACVKHEKGGGICGKHDQFAHHGFAQLVPLSFFFVPHYVMSFLFFFLFLCSPVGLLSV